MRAVCSGDGLLGQAIQANAPSRNTSSGLMEGGPGATQRGADTYVQGERPRGMEQPE
jgi:hypothetical protein